MHPDIPRYSEEFARTHQDVCALLASEISQGLTDAIGKIWHGHPVWFIDGNPIVGYSREKAGIRLMFWSGADFGEAGLDVVGKKFKDASVFYNDVAEVNSADLRRWLTKGRAIQWGLQEHREAKGQLERLT